MNDTQQAKKRSRWYKILGWVLLCLILLIGGLRLLLTTSWAQNWVRKSLLAYSKPYVNGELRIGGLDGDLWKTMRIRELAVNDSLGRQIATIDSLRIDYNLPSLLGSAFRVHRVRITSPEIDLKRDSTGRWNVSKTFRIPPKADTARSTFYFSIDSLQLQRGRADIHPSRSGSDTSYHISEMGIQAETGYDRQGYHIMLRELQFLARVPMLEDTLRLESRARYRRQAFSLEQLVISTGQSLFSTSGQYQVDEGRFEISSLLQPLSEQDIRSISDIAVRQNLDVKMSLEGSLSQFNTGLHLQAPAIEQFELSAGFNWDSTLALTEFTTNIRNFKGPELVEGQQLMLPHIDALQADFTGYMPYQEWRTGTLEGRINGKGLEYDAYRVEQITSTLSFDNRKASLESAISRSDERLNLSATAKLSPNGEPSPSWSMEMKLRNGKPGYWLGPDMLTGNLNMNGTFSGTGWMPAKENWQYNVRMFESRVSGQPVKRADLRGSINENRLSARTSLALEQSKVIGTLSVSGYRDVPRYQFDLQSEDFNVADLKGFEGNYSHLNLRFSGEGRGVTPGTMRLNSSINLDSSSVNGASIRELHGSLAVQDTVLTVREAELSSEIARGYFTARQHLLRFYDRDNRLDLNLEILNAQPLASFVDAERLEGRGRIIGEIRPFGDKMQFEGSMDLQQIVYNELVNIDTLNGTLQVQLKRNPYFKLEVDVDQPSVTGVILQDFNLRSSGTVDWDTARGSVAINLSSGTGAELSQQASFRIRPDSIELTTHHLDLKTPGRNLTLDSPFAMHVRSGVFSMDTLRLTSPQQPYLEAAVPRIDSLHQQAYLRANRINLQALQEVLLGRYVVGGYLTGFLTLTKEDRQVHMDTDLRVYELAYKNINVDSVQVDVHIRANRFQANTNIVHKGDYILQGGVELPFRLGDPEEFPASFFEQTVQGYVQLSPTRLDELEGAGELLGFEQTYGSVRGRVVLRGTAGMPLVSGHANMSDGEWSGVPIDSATVQMNYRHEEDQLSLTSDIVSLGQQALNIRASLPLQVDMRTWQVNIPRESETLNLTAETNRFNLSSLNEFLAEDIMRNLKGRLDGKVILSGSLENPSLDGSLQMSNAGVLLPQVGVTYGGMNGKMVFRKDEIRLQEFYVQNGGDLNAQGTLEFDGFLPSNMDLQVKARNFKAADTRQFQFIVSSDARMQGNLSTPKVSGDLSIRRGFFNLPEFGEKTVEKVELKPDQSDREQELSLYDSLNISMNLSVSPEFSIRNRRYANLEVGLEGQVDVLKEKGGELQLFGTINGRSGYIRTLGKRFEMEEAQLQFDGNPENPKLQMRFLYIPPQPEEDIHIYYVIGGTMENPTFSYDSDPPMELENIISYTLFGQPYYALDSWKQVVARPEGSGGVAGNLITEAIMNRIETLATQRLGVDVVQIENNPGGSGGGTSIKTGWYLNERTFLAILNTISGGMPTTTFILEYQLKKNLELILTQGNDSREGIDLHWQKDY